jgi:imidazolonepropionase
MTSVKSIRLWIRNLDELVQVCDDGQRIKRGSNQDDLSVLCRTAEGDGCSLIISSDGLIAFVGHDSHVPSAYMTADQVIDGHGCSLIPGLVDAHTHPVWAGDRSFEFALKAKGRFLFVLIQLFLSAFGSHLFCRSLDLMRFRSQSM